MNSNNINIKICNTLPGSIVNVKNGLNVTRKVLTNERVSFIFLRNV